MGQQYSRPSVQLFKVERTRGRGNAFVDAQFANSNTNSVYSFRCEASVQTAVRPIRWLLEPPEHSLTVDVAIQATNPSTAICHDSWNEGRTTAAVGCGTDEAPAEAVSGRLSRTDNVCALLDEIIQILEKDVKEGSEMCNDLQQYKLEGTEVRQQSPEILLPASHSATLTDAAGEREVEQDSADGLFANYSTYSRLSDSQASLREFEELEKTMELMEASSAQPSREMPVVRERVGCSTPKSVVCSEGEAKSAVLPYENKFWIGCGTDNLKVFKNPKDRRIESIARVSGCRITLSEIKRRNGLGQWQQLVVVESPSETGLKKCTNLLDERFPAFRASLGRMNYTPKSKQPVWRMAVVARELARQKADIAALSETLFCEQSQLAEKEAGPGRRICHPERHRGTTALSAAGHQRWSVPPTNLRRTPSHPDQHLLPPSDVREGLRMHPRSRQWHLLDYVLVRRRNQQDVLVTKAIPGADG
nr:unnamed protein product [Spirometra erinaceieuropaei]